jgi:hypothetical protein
MNRLLLPAVGALAVLGFAACSPDSKDFKSEGEDFIEEEDGQLASNLGYTFSDAECDKPANTDTGTIYDCTAVDDEGDTWDFSVEITGDRELTVNGVYHAKLVRNFVVEGLQSGGAGTVDEACVDELLAGYSEEDLKAAVTDYSMNAAPSAESEALFNEIGQAAATNCAS